LCELRLPEYLKSYFVWSKTSELQKEERKKFHVSQLNYHCFMYQMASLWESRELKVNAPPHTHSSAGSARRFLERGDVLN